MDNMNFLIVGVGGQGTLLASRVLGQIGIAENYDVKVSEVHGMSQRGGSVVTFVKYNEDKVNSPIIEKGEADIIIAFEELESLRWIDYLKNDGRLILNQQKINPMSVITGKEKYPKDIIEKFNSNNINLLMIDALKIAKECGNSKTANIVLIGVLAKTTSINKETWIDTLTSVIPKKVLEVNLKAFEAGYSS